MTCDEAQRLISASLGDVLDDAAVGALQDHLTSCMTCRDEAAGLQAVWRCLEDVTVDIPREEMRTQFYAMLAAETAPTATRLGVLARFDAWLRAWWPQHPVFHLALSIGLLLIGFWSGAGITRHETRADLKGLDQQVQRLQHLAISTALQLDSASERLAAVYWTYEVERPDQQILAALLYTLQHDPNVNVRLAALDALSRFSDRSFVREGLEAAIARQNSPLVLEPLQEVLQATFLLQPPDLRK